MQDKANKFRHLLTEDLGSALAYLKTSFNLLPDNQESLDLLLADHKSWLREDLNRTRSYEWLDTERRSLNKRALGLVKLLEGREYHLPTYAEKRFHQLVDEAQVTYQHLAADIPDETNLRFSAAPVLDHWMHSYADLAASPTPPPGRDEASLDKQLNELMDRIESWMTGFQETMTDLLIYPKKILTPLQPIETLLTEHPSLGLASNEVRFYDLIKQAEQLLPDISLIGDVNKAFRDEQRKISSILSNNEFAAISSIIKTSNAKRIYRFVPHFRKYMKLMEPAAEGAHLIYTAEMRMLTEITKLQNRCTKQVFYGVNMLGNIKAQCE